MFIGGFPANFLKTLILSVDIHLFRMDKGVIVYICDSRGVRDIYDIDGSSAVAPSEPLAVLVVNSFTFT